MEILNDRYTDYLQTQIRNETTKKEDLKKNLYELGKRIGNRICEDYFLVPEVVTTPMKSKYKGQKIDRSFEYLVVSTKDDHDDFALGVRSSLGDGLSGYIDFGPIKGKDIFTAPIRSIEFPEIRTGRPVKYIIISKSVIGSGCTAIALAQRAIEKYHPSLLIIASAFYSNRGLKELEAAYPYARIYVCGNADSINEAGMLIPGVGDIDNRRKIN